MNENFYNPFPVNTAVWDLRHGLGIVTDVKPQDVYPVKVLFVNRMEEQFTLEGKAYVEDINPMLYREQMQIVKLKPLNK
jgi:hypothetical protein